MLSPVVVILSPCVVHKENINFKQACFLGISLPKANLEGVAMEPLCFSCTCFLCLQKSDFCSMIILCMYIGG